MPRYFFGVIRVPMYEYYWGHTAAQIEMIDIDAPFICYARHETNSGLKPGDKGYKPNAKKLDATVKRWKERKAKREARGFRLDTFLETGDIVPVDNKLQ